MTSSTGSGTGKKKVTTRLKEHFQEKTSDFLFALFKTIITALLQSVAIWFGVWLVLGVFTIGLFLLTWLIIVLVPVYQKITGRRGRAGNSASHH